MRILTGILFSFTMALAISSHLIPVLVRIFEKLKRSDQGLIRSSDRKVFSTLGGIAIFPGFIIASTLGLFGKELPEFSFIIIALMLIFFTGLKIDILTISPLKKMIAQLIVSMILVFLANVRFSNIQGLFGFGIIGIIYCSIITIIAIIIIVNAFIFIDGIDGLTSGLSLLVALIAGSRFATVDSGYAILSFSLAGSVAGLLFYNIYKKQNKIALGNSGVLFLGAIISVLLIKFEKINSYQNNLNALESASLIFQRILTLMIYIVIFGSIIFATIAKLLFKRQLKKISIPYFHQTEIRSLDQKAKSRMYSRRLRINKGEIVICNKEGISLEIQPG